MVVAPSQETIPDSWIIKGFFWKRGIQFDLLQEYPDPYEGVWYQFDFPALGLTPANTFENAYAARAWHGSHWFAVASILQKGALVPGSAEPRGVYCHKNGTKSKAQGYMMHTPLGCGLFAAPMWQLSVQNYERIRGDQWIIRNENDVKIMSLHVHVLRQSELKTGHHTINIPMVAHL